MKIAIIDDEPSIRSLLRTLFEREGYEIVEANNGLTGLELIRTNIPDLIICDINMPEMSGDELFDTLHKSDPDLCVIPFIFLSGNVDTTEQIKRLNKGADNCFKKPIDLKLLVAHVNAHLSRVTRVSDFIKKELNGIAETLPNTINHDFSFYKSVTTNTHGYVTAIVCAMNNYRVPDSHSQSDDKRSETDKTQLLHNNITTNELSYIEYCLHSFKERRSLVRAANGEDLSWTLIFMVMKAQLEDSKIYVSDLYVSIPSAKSTINTRITSLIEDDVFNKVGDAEDGRRQQVFLTGRFEVELLSHINKSINLVRQID